MLPAELALENIKALEINSLTRISPCTFSNIRILSVKGGHDPDQTRKAFPALQELHVDWEEFGSDQRLWQGLERLVLRGNFSEVPETKFGGRMVLQGEVQFEVVISFLQKFEGEVQLTSFPDWSVDQLEAVRRKKLPVGVPRYDGDSEDEYMLIHELSEDNIFEVLFAEYEFLPLPNDIRMDHEGVVCDTEGRIVVYSAGMLVEMLAFVAKFQGFQSTKELYLREEHQGGN